MSTSIESPADELVVTNLPGGPEMPAALVAELAEALAGKGKGYVPRTHHLSSEGRPKYTNRLVRETSPYLLQHAHNPVNWYAWGAEAFEDARREDRPVFLSIGYSTCHWCHVMEGESFEDEEIAAFLNQHYVCIKVDREERPDVDAVYMSAVQSLTGSGGWPMSVFLTPDREPFFAGTYFPPRDGARGARHGFLTILRELLRTYRQDPERVRRAARNLTDAVRAEMEGAPAPSGAGTLPGLDAVARTVEVYKRSYDPVWGGLRRAPKFPSNVPVRLLLRHHRRTGDPQALAMAEHTLTRMAAGGMYDQIGGGFHRYSTDERWLVPHFEKMLYDNALLAVSYAEAHQATGRADFARVVREVLDYVLAEMTSPEGAFYSATDADSEGEEGKFFVWSQAEIRAVLGDEAERFERYYGITEGGNFEGHNIPFVLRPDEAEHAALADARRKLYEVRARRVPPLRDDKILAAWNGLMISAFAVGGATLGERRYVEPADRAATFILDDMRTDGRIARSWKDGRVQPQGFLEDQAFVVAGLLDLAEASLDPRWLREALAISEVVEARFADRERGAWYMTASDGEALLAREKPSYDGAEPSGTSVALLNALRLSAFTGDDRWRVVADRAFATYAEVLETRGVAMAEGLLAVDFRAAAPREIAIVWPQGGFADAAPLLDAVRRRFVPGKVMAGGVEGALDSVAAVAPFVGGKTSVTGKAAAYVCTQGRCELPVTDPEALARQLASG